jgi:hypothetical protein
MTKRKLSLSILSLLSVNLLFSQVDFNNYTTIKSSGKIPVDFTKETYTKVKEDIKKGKEELNQNQEKVFFEGTNYAIDEILHSGLVIYGDEMSTYISEIADHLLKNDADLRAKLRFYCIKSNSTNAFSTDQGIVFVTTGLLSQLTSEAQLAYVLAHEISHYTEKHVVETFDYKTKGYRQSERIASLSQYSKEKEFDVVGPHRIRSPRRCRRFSVGLNPGGDPRCAVRPTAATTSVTRDRSIRIERLALARACASGT